MQTGLDIYNVKKIIRKKVMDIYNVKKIIRKKVKYLLVVQSTHKCCMMDQLNCICFSSTNNW
jgi:hypothetical protein